MPVENLIGSLWYCPEGKRLVWHETCDTRKTITFGMEGTSCFLRNGEIEWRWKGKKIAGATHCLMDNGVVVFQLLVSPEISSIKIPLILVDQIKIWVSAEQDGDSLCGEIQEKCNEFNLDDNGSAAVGLLVHLLREDWTRV